MELPQQQSAPQPQETIICDENQPNRGIPSRAPETSRLIMFLKDKPMGTLCSYEDLSLLINKDVRSQGYNYLRSAREFLWAHCDQAWCCEPKVGVRRLTDEEIVEHTKYKNRLALKRIGKHGRRVQAADYFKLSTTELRQDYVMQRSMGFMAQRMTRQRTIEKLSRALPMEETGKIPDHRKLFEIIIENLDVSGD